MAWILVVAVGGKRLWWGGESCLSADERRDRRDRGDTEGTEGTDGGPERGTYGGGAVCAS